MKKYFLFACLSVSMYSCSRNAVTGRNQLTLYPESEIQAMAATEYRTFLTQNKVVSSSVSKDAEMVKRVGERITRAVTDYYTSQGKANVLDGYQWEYNLVDSK